MQKFDVDHDVRKAITDSPHVLHVQFFYNVPQRRSQKKSVDLGGDDYLQKLQTNKRIDRRKNKDKHTNKQTRPTTSQTYKQTNTQNPISFRSY